MIQLDFTFVVLYDFVALKYLKFNLLLRSNNRERTSRLTIFKAATNKILCITIQLHFVLFQNEEVKRFIKNKLIVICSTNS